MYNVEGFNHELFVYCSPYSPMLLHMYRKILHESLQVPLAEKKEKKTLFLKVLTKIDEQKAHHTRTYIVKLSCSRGIL